MAAQHIQFLIVVPDGALRLVPIAALYDGKQFAVEKYAVSMVTDDHDQYRRTRRAADGLFGWPGFPNPGRWLKN